VMCYAPRDAAVRMCMVRDSLSHDQAAKRVDEINRQRADWVRASWGREWASFEAYHLCVNTDALGLDGAADVILRAARDYFHMG